MADVSIPQEENKVYYRITMQRPSNMGLLIDNDVPVEDLERSLRFHRNLKRDIQKVELIHKVTTVEVRDVTEDVTT